MAELDQTSMPQFKQCSNCGETKSITKFGVHPTCKGGYRGICEKCRYAFVNRPYKNTPNGILANYRYWANDKGKETLLRNSKKFNETHPEYPKIRYHELQEKYGCHHLVGDWYPAARLIEALETAPIVEIKV